MPRTRERSSTSIFLQVFIAKKLLDLQLSPFRKALQKPCSLRSRQWQQSGIELLTVERISIAAPSRMRSLPSSRINLGLTSQTFTIQVIQGRLELERRRILQQVTKLVHKVRVTERVDNSRKWSPGAPCKSSSKKCAAGDSVETKVTPSVPARRLRPCAHWRSWNRAWSRARGRGA